MPTRPCAGPAPGLPCPTRQLLPARPGAKTAARCCYCRTQWQKTKDARRPDRRSYAEQERRRRTVATWIAEHGYQCPGIPGQVAPHPSHDLTAEHVDPVAITRNERGPLAVLCRPCNSKLGAALAKKTS